jgi:A/G-specific adenine glycosylase
MPVESDPQQNAAIRAALQHWYQGAARILPWRAPPGSAQRPDPYWVWLSEVMLQQTTVAAVIPYFARFTARWPTVAALAAADDADILASWAGLGYYSRARNLIAAARAVVSEHGGQFPRDMAALRALPGVGDYTAAAIAAFAFGADSIPLDANLERVLARLFCVETPLPQARGVLSEHGRALWPAQAGGDFAQALMDLGARICTARRPLCDLCPVAARCRAHAAGRAAELPVKPAKKARPERHGRAQWIVREGEVWLVRRPAKGMLGGMRALPGGDWGDVAVPPTPGGQPLGQVRHIFTHFALMLAVDAPIDVDAAATAAGPGEWWPLKELDAAGLPTLYQRAAMLALAHSEHAGPHGEDRQP